MDNLQVSWKYQKQKYSRIHIMKLCRQKQSQQTTILKLSRLSFLLEIKSRTYIQKCTNHKFTDWFL